MSETTSEQGTELVLTSPGERLKKPRAKRSKPELIQVGRGYLCSDSRFHPDLAADYIRANARDSWLSVGKLARVFVGNTIHGKRTVRKQMCAVFGRLLATNDFLVYETDPSSGRTLAVKLLDVTSEQERQAARPQLQRMRQRQQVSADKYEKAIQLIELKETMAEQSMQATR